MGAGLVLIAGILSFSNDWLQTGQVNWRIPIATLIGGWLVGELSALDNNAGTSLGVMVLIAAATAPLNGKSPVEELSSVLPTKKG